MSETIDLKKALEAGQLNVAPGARVQGGALGEVQDISPVMEMVVADSKAYKLQKMLDVKSVKSNLVQFKRQLSYGRFGGSARREGQVGRESTNEYTNHVVPMAYYSDVRRVSDVANMVSSFDGIKAEEREGKGAAEKIAFDIEMDLFKGWANFSNSGVFDGSPAAFADLPNMQGLDVQVRISDLLRNAQDLMFASYGGSTSNVISVGGVLAQGNVEDSHVRSLMNHGDADVLFLDPLTLSAYNKISFAKERIMLAGSAQGATGADLRKQFVSMGEVALESSRFLSGKTNSDGGGNLGIPTATVANTPAGSALAAGVYIYNITAVNDDGESAFSADVTSASILAGDSVTLTITPPGAGTVRYFNVYRTLVGGATGTTKFIGSVAYAGATTQAFVDLGNKLPGFVTGFLIQKDTMKVAELAPFSRKNIAETDLSKPEVCFRFACLAVLQPRKNVLLDNVTAS